jgi:hypothetical protein
MQVWDTVKVKSAPEDDQESIGRAGRVTKVEGDDGPEQQVTVELDETTTHESGEAVYAQKDLEFLGR